MNRNRSRDYYRKQRAKHIARKQRKIKEWSFDNDSPYWVCPNGALSKGKIHCSCPLCRSKSYEYKTARDLARFKAMDESERYYYEGYPDEVDDEDALNSGWLQYMIGEYDYYYSRDYYDWLEYHPDGSTD